METVGETVHGILTPGMRVCEEGLGVVGEIVGEGDFPGEWLVRVPDGQVVACLAENLKLWLREFR
jgi:hypothetical protein